MDSAGSFGNAGTSPPLSALTGLDRRGPPSTTADRLRRRRRHPTRRPPVARLRRAHIHGAGGGDADEGKQMRLSKGRSREERRGRAWRGAGVESEAAACACAGGRRATCRATSTPGVLPHHLRRCLYPPRHRRHLPCTSTCISGIDSRRRLRAWIARGRRGRSVARRRCLRLVRGGLRRHKRALMPPAPQKPAPIAYAGSAHGQRGVVWDHRHVPTDVCILIPGYAAICYADTSAHTDAPLAVILARDGSRRIRSDI
ncbi:hypothetical protein C8J57DRAFT_453487 [Mycena rebaudengoi]|nr:hypothetical protein C8J57DRAFT_453487 [Mycena rebaudengoi]